MIAAAYSDPPEAIGFDLARALFAPNVAVVTTDPRAPHYRVLPQEVPAMARAVIGRKRAFSAGRAAAHQAMTELGVAVAPVVMGSDRAPIWPVGLTGSISHSQTCCIAALARSSDVQSLGVDVEEDTGLAPDLFDVVCTPAERTWLAAQPEQSASRLAKLIFSAKETAYKCQYPISLELFGFDRLDTRFDLEAGSFTATFTDNVAGFAKGHSLRGRFVMDRGLIVTAMSLLA